MLHPYQRQAMCDAILCACGQKIRASRQQKGLSLESLAAAIPLSPGHLGRLETGGSPINLATLFLIALALGTDLHSLIPRMAPDPFTEIDAIMEGLMLLPREAHRALLRVLLTSCDALARGGDRVPQAQRWQALLRGSGG